MRHSRSISPPPLQPQLEAGGVSHYFDNDDRDATRTLFVGNLDNDIESVFLERLFARYGIVEDVDIKRNLSVLPPYLQRQQQMRGGGLNEQNSKTYAFVRYENMDMAMQAKKNMNGKRLNGRNECKIGYGKWSSYSSSTSSSSI